MEEAAQVRWEETGVPVTAGGERLIPANPLIAGTVMRDSTCPP